MAKEKKLRPLIVIEIGYNVMWFVAALDNSASGFFEEREI